MNATDTHTIEQLKHHLASQLTLKQRETDFDMDDAPEASVLQPFEELQTGLFWLESNVTQPWRISDQKALRFQLQHRRLARLAIFAGTAAIVLAVLQLSIKLTLLIEPAWPTELTTAALILEAIAVGAALIAVGFGLRTKFDRRWLGERHLAERLRMLKFRALEQLLCRDRVSWQSWLQDELEALRSADYTGAIKEWSKGGEIEPDVLTSPKSDLNSLFVQALTTYYSFKRLDFQANYFKRRRETYERQVSGWRHLNLPLFLTSAIFVLAHFALEYRANGLRATGGEELAKAWEVVAAWCVTLAAIIPILGLGIRAWFAAFEMPRNASLFAAKYRAILHATKHLEADFGKPLPTLHHIAWSEHFLEHEHREWLRLLLETEWFL